MYCQEWPGKINTNITECPDVGLMSNLWKRSHEAGAGLFFLYIMQWLVHSLMTSRPATAQNLLDSIDSKWFAPAERLFSSWYDLTIILVTGLSLGNINRNLASYGKNSAYFSRPLHLINPSLSNSGETLVSLLLVERRLPLWRASYSCLKYSFCDDLVV